MIMIKREFLVDDICYVLELSNENNIIFYIDVHKSRYIDIPLTDYDKLAPFWEDIKPTIIYTQDLVNTEIKHFFQIKKIMVGFVEEVANRGTKHFNFSANEDKKLNIYRKVANSVAKKYGYFLYEIGSNFQFYKSP